jgi:hypothetical protein
MKHNKDITIAATIATIAMRWGIKNGGTAAKLAAKAIWWGEADKPLTPSRYKAAKRAHARLTRLAKGDEHTAYCLCREMQRLEWLATFPARN